MSVVPALTPPAWTSLMTGRSPGAHGIFDFFRRESTDTQHIRLLTSVDIEVETVFSIANRHGARATVLNFPLTFPAPPLEGYVVPGGWMPWKQLRLGCRPSALYDQLKANVPGFNPRELAMDMAHEEKALEGCRSDEYDGWIDLHIRRERQWFEVVDYLMRSDPTELTAVLFDGVDKLQHLCWRFIDPALEGSITEEAERAVAARCREYFRVLDSLVGDIVATAGPDATVVLASDHGFGAQVRTFFVNTWLQEQGYLAWAEGRAPLANADQVLGIGHLAKHVFQLDWSRTRAYAPMPSGNGIHIVLQGPDTPGGVPPAEYHAFRDRLRRDLLEQVRDPISGEPVVARVWARDETFAGPAMHLAPDLTLELTDGGLVSILSGATAVERRAAITGTHRCEGMFAAAGPQIPAGTRLPALSILDVTPLLLETLGIRAPEAFEGRLPAQLVSVRRQPYREAIGARPSAEPVLAGPSTALNPDAEAEIMRRLRALGYVE
jgi:predicted AlkP superfamily phosphohydrolase/phosphomutase